MTRLGDGADFKQAAQGHFWTRLIEKIAADLDVTRPKALAESLLAVKGNCSLPRPTPKKFRMPAASFDRLTIILQAMYELSDGTTKPLNYEDMVVRAWELSPKEFALRGYPQHPDSSDLHKPLYGPLKKKGLVQNADKHFALTPKGVEIMKKLLSGKSSEVEQGDRLSRDKKHEVDRMLKTEGWKLFLNGQASDILDTDFLVFVGSTVRTKRGDFEGRITTTREAVESAAKLNYPDQRTASRLSEMWTYLTSQFAGLIKKVGV